MNLLGNEVSQREMVLMGITLGALLIFGIYLLGKPGSSESQSPEEFLETLNTSASRLETSLLSVNKLTKSMSLTKFQMPSTDDSPKVFSHIDKIARASGLSFPALSPSAPKKGRRFQTINYRIVSTSDLNALIKFVDEIQQGEYLICLESWDMKPAEDKAKIVANLTLRAYFGPGEGGKKK